MGTENTDQNEDGNVYFYKLDHESLAHAVATKPQVKHFVGIDSLHQGEELYHCDLAELADPEFGLEEFMEGSTKICTASISSWRQKEALLSDIETYATAAHCFPDFSKCAANLTWELVMSALSRNASNQNLESITVQYAKNNDAFWIYIKDTYGALSREDLIKTLSRGENADERGTLTEGDSGDLYLVLSSVSQLIFRVEAGMCTEAIAVIFQSKHNHDHVEHPPSLSFIERKRLQV